MVLLCVSFLFWVFAEISSLGVRVSLRKVWFSLCHFDDGAWRVPARQPASRPGSQRACQTSSQPASQPDVWSARCPASHRGSQTSSQPANEPTRTSSPATSQTSTQLASRPDVQPAIQPEVQPASEPASQAFSQSPSEPARRDRSRDSWLSRLYVIVTVVVEVSIVVGPQARRVLMVFASVDLLMLPPPLKNSHKSRAQTRYP